MFITIKSMINAKYFLDLTPGSMWHNVLFSGEALCSVKVRTMGVVGVTIQAL